MRSKTNRVTTLTIFAVLLALLSALLLLPNGAATANAATTPKYAVSFDYTCYYQYNTSKKVDSSGTVWQFVVRYGNACKRRHDQIGYGQYRHYIGLSMA